MIFGSNLYDPNSNDQPNFACGTFLNGNSEKVKAMLNTPVQRLTFLAVLLGLTCVVLFVGNRPGHCGPFIAEVSLPDQVHKLRLLETKAEAITYEWKPSATYKLISKVVNYRGRLHDIDLKRIQEVPFAEWKPTSFLFRVVDDRDRWANLDASRLFRFEFIDSNNYIYSSHSEAMLDDNGSGAYLLETSAFPRRDKDLKIRFKFYGPPKPGNEMPVEITFPNPYYRTDFPVWSPEAVPVEKSVGGMTVRLEDLGSSSRFRDPTFRQKVGDNRWVRCDVILRVEDATGNQGKTLSPFEPGWKLIADVFPSPETNFPDAQIHSVGKFTIPAYGEVTPIEKVIDVAGTTITVHCVCGGGSVERMPDGRWLRTLKSPPSRGRGNMIDRGPTCLSEQEPFVVVGMRTIDDKNRGIVARARTDSRFRGTTLRSFQSNSYVAIQIRGSGNPSPEFTFELIDSQTRRFEYIVAPLQKWRDEFVHPSAETKRASE